jgi:1-acylglycerone phosphate reductase
LSHLAQLSNVDILSIDITSPASVAAAVEAVTAKTGGSLDYLVNNSGVGYFAPLLDSDLGKRKEMLEVNLWGVLSMTEALSPLLIAAKGTVVNSSISSVLYPPWIGSWPES